MFDARRHAPAATRNRESILAVLRETLPISGCVLEVASGTGEHAVHFARALPDLVWQPSDPDPASRASIADWRASEGLANLREPIDLDVTVADWPVEPPQAIVCINMAHISPWAATEGLIAGASRLLDTGAPLVIYGPFRRKGHPLEPSNRRFHEDLKLRDPAWGLRLIEDVRACALDHDLEYDQVVQMPANNLTLIFRKR